MVGVSRRGILAAGAAVALGVMTPAANAADILRVGVASVYPPFVAMHVAQQEGYFADLGVEVEITQYRSGSAVQEAVAAGAVDVYAVPPPTVAVGVQKGLNAKIISRLGPPSPRGWRILVPTESSVQSMADMAGKKIAITGKGSLTDFFAMAAAAKSNVTVDTIPLGNGVLPALEGAQVDAAVVWPLLSFQLIQSGKYRVIDDFSDVKDTPLDVWVASGQAIAEKPAAIKSFLSGFRKGLEKVQSDEAFGLAALAKYTEQNDPEVLKQAYAELIKPASPDGVITPAGVDAALKFGAIEGVEATKVADFQFVPVQ